MIRGLYRGLPSGIKGDASSLDYGSGKPLATAIKGAPFGLGFRV